MSYTKQMNVREGHVPAGTNDGQVVNVCFHGVGTPERGIGPDEGQYWIGTDEFEELLEAICRYPWIRISFDDGNASDAALALPALLRHGLSAAFFVVGDRIDQPGSLSTADIRELVSAGMTVGLHGMRHRPWRSLGASELRIELVDARQMVAEAAGRPVSEVACPFGSYDRRVLGAIRREGFARVYTVDDGPARGNTWLQSRFTIVNGATVTDIARMAQSPADPRLTHVLRTGKAILKRVR